MRSPQKETVNAHSGCGFRQGRGRTDPCFAAPPSWADMQISDTVRKGVVFLGWKDGTNLARRLRA